jgi:WD40 repeat protein
LTPRVFLGKGERREGQRPAAPLQCMSLTLSSDGSILAAAGDSGVIHLDDTLTGQALLTLQGHKTRIQSLAFSPDG